MKEKVKPSEELKTIVNRSKEEGKKIVFTNGCFDLIHVGHVRYLEKTKKLGDILIVGMNSDSSVRTIKGDSRPIIPEAERAEVLAALQCVDFVVIFDEPDPLSLISSLKPDVLVKGGDWSKDAIIGREVVESAGGRVILIPEIEGASTSNIIRKIAKMELT